MSDINWFLLHIETFAQLEGYKENCDIAKILAPKLIEINDNMIVFASGGEIGFEWVDENEKVKTIRIQ